MLYNTCIQVMVHHILESYNAVYTCSTRDISYTDDTQHGTRYDKSCTQYAVINRVHVAVPGYTKAQSVCPLKPVTVAIYTTADGWVLLLHGNKTFTLRVSRDALRLSHWSKLVMSSNVWCDTWVDVCQAETGTATTDTSTDTLSDTCSLTPPSLQHPPSLSSLSYIDQKCLNRRIYKLVAVNSYVCLCLCLLHSFCACVRSCGHVCLRAVITDLSFC